MRFLLVAALCICVAFPQAGRCQSVAEWHNVTAETGKIDDIPGLVALADAFPDSASVHLRLLSAYLGADDRELALSEAIWLAERGYVFSDASQDQILSLEDDAGGGVARLANLFALNSKPIQQSSITATVSVDAKLVEGVALDPLDNSIIVTTVISRQIFGQRKDGSWRFLPVESADSLSGIGFNPEMGDFWVASGDLGMTPAGRPQFHGLYRFKRGQPLEPDRFPAPEGGSPSDLTVSDDGRVFASDPLNGAIYQVNEASGTLSYLVAPGTFRSPQGLAVSEDGGLLYVSDYRWGIAIVDLQTRKISRLAAIAPMILDGIDGLYRSGNRLIGIQNGMKPMRIVAIDLSDDGIQAKRLDVLERAHREWTEPLGGTIHDGALYYIATGQWDRYGRGGQSIEGKPQLPTQIRRLVF